MIGKTLGHYRIGGQLGRGGMGEVYVADDLNLNRRVALKFLPEAFAGDPERMARFEREAKLLASLNHPNIAAIYGLEQAEGKRFIVMELVEGETLQQRISKGPLPVDDALTICRQIAEGLEAAHEKGVIHRDLKPANVMITEGDKVKILDFGLAKALSDEAQSVDSSQSPTLTEAMTRPGVILGTAAYMSPEQAKGKSVDKRADIWAFGCILYECLAGKRAFEGETVTETLAATLKEEPDLEKVPTKVRPLLRSCLEKNTSRRLRDIGDAWRLLEGAPESASAKRPWVAWCLTAVLLIAFLVLLLVHFRKPEAAASEPVQFQITPTVRPSPLGSFALSPDGRHLAFAGVGPDGAVCLWLRSLNSLEARPLPRTESNILPPFFWSPDSRYIVFDSGGKLKKVDINGGLPQTICDISTTILGGSWNSDGVIILGNLAGGLMRVSSKGGTLSALTRLQPQESQHSFPAFLPDGKHFLYFSNSAASEKTGIYEGSLDAGPEKQSYRKIVASDRGMAYVPSRDDSAAFLLYLRGQTLMAQSFDDHRLILLGEPVPLAEMVATYGTFYPLFSVSTKGVLAYLSGVPSQLSRATWFDRQGKAHGTIGEPSSFYGLALSPDSTRVVAGLANKSGQTDLWVLDLARDNVTRFTFGQRSLNVSPVWSPDGSRIVFSSSSEAIMFKLYQKSSSGAGNEEPLHKYELNLYTFPTSWSKDGRFLLYNAWNPNIGKGNLSVLPLEGDRKPISILGTEFDEIDGRFSPDMRWIAYMSDESGGNQIYVRPFSHVSGSASPEAEGKWQISKGGGIGPRWRGDGKELYYRALDGKIMAVDVTPGPTFQFGTPKPLFQAPPDLSEQAILYAFPSWDVTPDGNKFLLPAPVAEISPSPFTVILNWTALLKK